MSAERRKGGVPRPAEALDETASHRGLIGKPRVSIPAAAAAGALAWVGLAAVLFSAGAEGAKTPAVKGGVARTPSGSPPDVVVHVSDLPKSALSEFAFWHDPASPGGRMAGTPNTGDELDPPPENDPHVVFKVKVQPGVPYRCWIHMRVGKPKGKSQANLFFAQFTDAVDKAHKEVFKPGTGSYLSLRGPAREGWAWVGRDSADPKSAEPLIYFRAREVTVRLQAGMEGVGFDQLVLSPGRFLEKPPSDAVVGK